MVDHPTFHPNDWEPEVGAYPTGTIQELAARQTRSTYLRYLVWVTVAEACRIVFPLSRLAQRMLDKRPVEPAFLCSSPDLLPDRPLANARVCALRVFREENNLPKPDHSDSPLND